MKRTTLGTTLIASAVSVVLSGALTGCGYVQPPPFEPRQIERIQRAEAEQTETRPLRSLPTTLQTTPDMRQEDPGARLPASRPYRSQALAGPTRPMSLQEIMHRAVANNLDVRVAGYDAAIDELRILEAEARFDPTIFIQGQLQKQYQPTQDSILNPDYLHTQTLQGGIRQTLESGGQIELRAQTTRNDPQNGLVSGIVPISDHFYQNELILQITQPLLKNFGGDVNRARISISKNDQRISELDFRERLERTLQEIEEAYWTLVQAQRDVRILERLLEDTDRTTDILVRRGGHDVNRVQISQSTASAEARAATLVSARARVGDISDRLKRLMNDPDFPVVSPVTVVPADDPVEDPVIFALADQIDAALQHRTELQQQKFRIDSADVIVRAAKNNLLPELNLQGSVGLQGAGSHIDEATKDTERGVWAIALAFEVPIGNRGPRAIYQRTLLSRQQAIEQYRNLVEVVAESVKVAHREVETRWNEMIATRQARFAAADALLAIEQRERAGESLTATFVQLKLDRQEALAQAERQEIQAVRDYNVAISALERAKGTILRYNNIDAKEAPGPELMNLWRDDKWPWSNRRK